METKSEVQRVEKHEVDKPPPEGVFIFGMFLEGQGLASTPRPLCSLRSARVTRGTNPGEGTGRVGLGWGVVRQS